MMPATKTERCLARLQRLIPKPDSRLVSRHTEKCGEEYVEVVLEFRICGAYLDSGGRKIMVLIAVEKLDSGDIELGPRIIRDLITTTIMDELAWMNGTKWDLSIDANSMNKVRRKSRKADYQRSVIQPIKRGEMSEEEAAEALAEVLAELRPELREVLISAGAVRVREGLIRIEGNGLPCPLCLGHLSEEDVFSMYHRLRFMNMFSGDGEED